MSGYVIGPIHVEGCFHMIGNMQVQKLTCIHYGKVCDNTWNRYVITLWHWCMGKVNGPWGEVVFIIVGGIVCVTIHVLNRVNAYKYLDAQALILQLKAPTFFIPTLFTENIGT